MVPSAVIIILAILRKDNIDGVQAFLGKNNTNFTSIKLMRDMLLKKQWISISCHYMNDKCNDKGWITYHLGLTFNNNDYNIIIINIMSFIDSIKLFI